MIEISYRNTEFDPTQRCGINDEGFAFNVTTNFQRKETAWEATGLYGRDVFKASDAIFTVLLIKAGVEITTKSLINYDKATIYIFDCSGKDGIMHAVILKKPSGSHEVFFVAGGPDDMRLVPRGTDSTISSHSLDCFFMDIEVHMFEPLWKGLVLYPERFKNVLTFEKMFVEAEENPLTGLLRDKNGPNRACAVQLLNQLKKHQKAWVEDIIASI